MSTKDPDWLEAEDEFENTSFTEADQVVSNENSPEESFLRHANSVHLHGPPAKHKPSRTVRRADDHNFGSLDVRLDKDSGRSSSSKAEFSAEKYLHGKLLDGIDVSSPIKVENFGIVGRPDPLDSDTIRRHGSRFDLSRDDLLKLLSYLEGELQAREVAIALLKAERVRNLILQAKFGKCNPSSDPVWALARDAEAVSLNQKGSNDQIALRDSLWQQNEAEVRALYQTQLSSLDNLVQVQQRSQQTMKEQIQTLLEKYKKACTELEEERQKHAQDTAEGDDVTMILTKERERLKQELEFEKSAARKLDRDMKKLRSNLEEERELSNKHKQVALLLIKQRKGLAEALIKERQKTTRLEQMVRVQLETASEGLEDKVKADMLLESQLAEVEAEKNNLMRKLSEAEMRSQSQERELEVIKEAGKETRAAMAGYANLPPPVTEATPRMVNGRSAVPAASAEAFMPSVPSATPLSRLPGEGGRAEPLPEISRVQKQALAPEYGGVSVSVRGKGWQGASVQNGPVNGIKPKAPAPIAPQKASPPSHHQGAGVPPIVTNLSPGAWRLQQPSAPGGAYGAVVSGPRVQVPASKPMPPVRDASVANSVPHSRQHDPNGPIRNEYPYVNTGPVVSLQHQQPLSFPVNYTNAESRGKYGSPGSQSPFYKQGQPAQAQPQPQPVVNGPQKAYIGRTGSPHFIQGQQQVKKVIPNPSADYSNARYTTIGGQVNTPGASGPHDALRKSTQKVSGKR